MEVEIDLRDGPIRVAVAGLGAIGRQHVRLLDQLEEFDLVAVCDADSDARRTVGEHLDVSSVERYSQLLDFKPQAIIIALPTSLHFEAASYFLDYGLNLLVEKPVASTVEEAWTLARKARASASVLLVGHVERFNAGVQVLKEQIASGRLGEVISVVSRRVGVARPAIPHANVALDLAIHDVDVVRYLLATPGELIASAGSKIGDNQLEDHVDLVLRYGKVFCTVQANWITPVKIRRLSVTGSRGTAELDYISQQLSVYEAVPEIIKGESWNFFAVSTVSPAVDVPVEKSEPLRAELKHFADCIRNRATPAVPIDQACEALELVVTASEIEKVLS